MFLFVSDIAVQCGNVPWIKYFVTFLKDPSVVHLHSPKQFNNLLKTESGPILAMIYAPWCGHCKRRKLDYQMAAAEMKGLAVLAAMDANKLENSLVTRFPTLLVFDEGR